MKDNLTGLIAIGVGCGIGYLISGSIGAAWGGVICGSGCLIGEALIWVER